MKLLLTFLCLWTLRTTEGTHLDKRTDGSISGSTVLEYVMRLDKTVTSFKSELTSHIDKTVASLKSDMTSMTSRITTLEDKTENFENWTKNNYGMGKLASFHVQQSGDHLPLGNKEVLKFDDVRVNTGTAYNSKSGIFTAPVTGTYLFWANIMSRTTNVFAITVQREGQEICRGYPGRQAYHGVATITCMAKLMKGDHVWFANEEHSKTIVFGGRYSSYGGTLLYV